MELDRAYEEVPYKLPEMEHGYGKNIRLLADPALLTLLMQFCSPETVQPRANRLLKIMYEHLLIHAMNAYCPRIVATHATRMSSAHPGAKYHGTAIDRSLTFVVMDLMRAGIFPSHICYDMLHDFIPENHIRQDHIVAARKTDSNNQVIGVELSGSKIGGTVGNSILVIPDPMAATGGTVTNILRAYDKDYEGPAKDVWLLHLIVTPEYIQKISKEFPNAKVLAIRCDRGLSAPEVYKKKLGSDVSKEKGLNSHQYIVPGGGGIGEILNNSFV